MTNLSEKKLEERIKMLEGQIFGSTSGESPLPPEFTYPPSIAGGAFEDVDGDGTAELKDDHADFQGGDAKNMGNLGAKAFQGTVNAGHVDFADGQEAIDYAENNGYGEVMFPYGEWGPVVVNSVRITGSSKGVGGAVFKPSDTAPAIDVQGTDHPVVGHVHLDTDGNTGQPAINLAGNQIVVIDCFFRNADAEAVVSDQGYCKIHGCHFGNSAAEITLTSNSYETVISDNSFNGTTVTNNGTNNVITDNA